MKAIFAERAVEPRLAKYADAFLRPRWPCQYLDLAFKRLDPRPSVTGHAARSPASRAA